MANIVTIGEILVEVMATEIGQAFDETGIYKGPFPSGAPAIFIDQAARCGSSAMIISVVGNDGFGSLNMHRLEESGVDIKSIYVLDDETTGVAFVRYKENGNRDFIYHISNAACGRINRDMVKEEYFKDCKYFHIMGSSIYNDAINKAIKRAIGYAKEYGAKISFDPNVRKEIIKDEKTKMILKEFLDIANIVVAGEDELSYVLGLTEESEIVDYLYGKSADIIVVKRGSRGSTLYIDGKIYDINPTCVEEVDPTGAGDCYVGTFISCLNQGIEALSAAQYASLAGALAVTKKGPMCGNSTMNELINM